MKTKVVTSESNLRNVTLAVTVTVASADCAGEAWLTADELARNEGTKPAVPAGTGVPVTPIGEACHAQGDDSAMGGRALLNASRAMTATAVSTDCTGEKARLAVRGRARSGTDCPGEGPVGGAHIPGEGMSAPLIPKGRIITSVCCAQLRDYRQGLDELRP